MGIADVVRATITYKILTEKMQVITRSVVRTATKGGAYQNQRANERAPTLAPKPVNRNLKIGKETRPIVVETVDDDEDEEPETKLMKKRKAEVVMERAWMTSDISSLIRISVYGTMYSVKSVHTK